MKVNREMTCLEEWMVHKEYWVIIVSSPRRLELQSMLLHAVKASYGYSSVRPINGTTVLVPIYKNQEGTDLLTEVCST